LPISTSYYLARLLFVQSQSAPFARILIGMEAHSEEEYEQHVRPFRGRDWPGGLLRLTVYDEESPREIPSDVSTQQDDQDILMGDSYSLDGDHRRPRRHGHHEHRHIHGHHHGHHRGHHRRGDLPQWACPHPSFIAPPPPPLPPLPPPPPPPPPPFFSPFFHVPSPPAPPSRHGSPLIVPPLPILSPHIAHPAPPLPSLPPIQPLSQDYTRQQSPPPTVDGAETPVQRYFRRRGLRSVASAPLLAPSLPVPPPPPPPPPPRPVSLYGEVQIADSPVVMRPNRRAATVSDEVDEFEMQAMAERVVDKGKLRDTCCDVERGKQEISDIIRTFKNDIDRVLSQSLHMEPAEVWSFSSTERQPSSTPLSPSNSDRTVATNQNQLPEPTRAAEAPSDVEPVIHVNVLCDNCQEVIIGVRHKCLDCAGLTSPLSFAALTSLTVYV
jgi:next-to-BRCA1 protein 1